MHKRHKQTPHDGEAERTEIHALERGVGGENQGFVAGRGVDGGGDGEADGDGEPVGGLDYAGAEGGLRGEVLGYVEL
jgi:hypothetical protein